MILIRIMSFVHSFGISDLAFGPKQGSPSPFWNTMDSPSEVKPGRIKPAVQDDPRIPPAHRSRHPETRGARSCLVTRLLVGCLLLFRISPYPVLVFD